MFNSQHLLDFKRILVYLSALDVAHRLFEFIASPRGQASAARVFTMVQFRNSALTLLLILSAALPCLAQGGTAAKVRLGSETAKGGFRNETEIAAKFSAWRTDEDAKTWLAFMGYKLVDIESVTATKPHGEKADVEVNIKTAKGSYTEGISIKLVGNVHGFNQIDKRWVSRYAEIWKMPEDVEAALKLFVGETKPEKTGRAADRVFIDELDAGLQTKVVNFISDRREQIVSDLFEGDGAHRAKWIMVALKTSDKPRWILRSTDYAKEFFGKGKVAITSRGNLKIGKITVQRKGGDGGRKTARMLQFKINPALLFDGK